MRSLAYSGSITTVGSSEALRLEKALFRQHPEFQQKAKLLAHVIGPGTLLVQVEAEPAGGEEQDDDPMFAAFLAFIENDIMTRPQSVSPLSDEDMRKAIDLVKDVTVSDDDDIQIDP